MKPSKDEMCCIRELLRIDGLKGRVFVFPGGRCRDTGAMLNPQTWNWCFTKNQRGQNICRFSMFAISKNRRWISMWQKHVRICDNGVWLKGPLNAEIKRRAFQYFTSLPLDLVMLGALKLKNTLPVDRNSWIHRAVSNNGHIE